MCFNRKIVGRFAKRVQHAPTRESLILYLVSLLVKLDTNKIKVLTAWKALNT